MENKFGQEHTLTRSGVPLHYWLAGVETAPLLAFTHGATMDHFMFAPQMEAFSSDYRVLTWDVRGHGQSRPIHGEFSLEDCADDLAAILDHIGVERAVLIGQSLGGYIAQYTYLRHPDRVQAVVSIGSTCIALPYPKWEVVALKWSLPLMKLYPWGYFKRLVARNTSIKPDVQAYAYETISHLNREEFFAIWKPVTFAVREQGIPNHKIRVPLLLTHGDHDGAGTVRQHALEWAQYEPDARYVVIPDAGHNANQDNPDYFNRTLSEFLRERVLSNTLVQTQPTDGRESHGGKH